MKMEHTNFNEFLNNKCKSSLILRSFFLYCFSMNIIVIFIGLNISYNNVRDICLLVICLYFTAEMTYKKVKRLFTTKIEKISNRGF